MSPRRMRIYVHPGEFSRNRSRDRASGVATRAIPCARSPAAIVATGRSSENRLRPDRKQSRISCRAARASADPRRSSESSARDHLLLCGLHDVVRLDRVALGSAYDHIDMTAPAFGAHQPIAPTEHGSFGAVPRSHLAGVGLNLMLAILAPDD
jgi:hypothetical protein